jgi:predicted nucleotidyltransferase
MNKKTKKRKFSEEDYSSGDGMLTSTWGPALWHYLHMMSFNYPIHPTKKNKNEYKDFIYNLRNVLPCKYCRENLTKNLKAFPLTNDYLQNRDTYSRYVYELHEVINKMLGKKNNLTYEDVRERYEHFRSRCLKKTKKSNEKKQKKEKGCINSLYGRKTKCLITIIPNEKKINSSFVIDKKCNLE